MAENAHSTPVPISRRVELHARALEGLSTGLLYMQAPGGVTPNNTVQALAQTLSFHAEQLCEALGIDVKSEDEPCA